MGELAREALDFLQGTKTSEAMSPELRHALYVQRRVGGASQSLEDALVTALLGGTPVVVTGSAGGGKTALIDEIVERLVVAGAAIADMDELPDTAGPQTIVVVRDLTAVTGDRSARLGAAVAHGPLLLGANEGVLLELNLPAPLQLAPEKLRELQQGSTPIGAGFVLVDLAGLDPVRTSLAQLLAHPLLHEAVAANGDGCPSSDLCPRQLALAQLQDPRVAELVAGLVSEGLGSGEVLFRDAWDLVSDMFLGGSCDVWPPTSTWFWRLFYGRTPLSDRIAAALMPGRLSLPAISPYLFRGHWQRVQQSLGTELFFVELDVPPVEQSTDEIVMVRSMDWMRIQYLLLKRAIDPRAPRFVGEVGLSLERTVLREGQVTVLIQAINAYFRRREPEIGDSSALSLWVEMSTERRTDRARQLVCLGHLSSTRLEIRRSQVIGGIQNLTAPGSRYFLVAGNGAGGQLSLDARLFQAIARGRPILTSDRTNDDADFALRSFFFSLVGQVESENPNTIELLEWSQLNGSTESKWGLTSEGLVKL